MQKQAFGSLNWLTFDLFREFPKLVHGVFLRHGGVSGPPFDSLNFSTSVGDLPLHVEENRARALKVLGISSFCGLWTQHGSDLSVVTKPTKAVGDGLLTLQKNLGLFVLHADCQAAIFYDPIKHALANIHCGWRGNVENIYKKTIHAMREHFGSRPENLLVGISPSLGPEASEFINHKTELPESFYPFQRKPTYFDLWEISRSQLLEEHILPDHIEIARICTYSNPTDFFSYRRAKTSGRHATVAALL